MRTINASNFTTCNNTSNQPAHNARAFTIVELLVVVVIIGVLVTILIPVIGTARDQARLAATRSLMTNIGTAAVGFENDERRRPGFFPISELANNGNVTLGLTAMDNAMFDLAGGLFTEATPGSFQLQAAFLDNNTRYHIDPSVIGAPQNIGSTAARRGGYFQPPPEFFRANVGRVSSSTELRTQLPSIVDAFGQPILAWVADDQPSPSNTDNLWFAANTTADAPNDGRPFFYWATNAGFLQSQALGREIANIRDNSMIGSSRPEAARRRTLAALLGHPSFPDVAFTTFQRPIAARGTFVLHSAGRNGIWLGDEESAAKVSFGSAQNRIDYTANNDAVELSDDEIAAFGL